MEETELQKIIEDILQEEIMLVIDYGAPKGIKAIQEVSYELSRMREDDCRRIGTPNNQCERP